MRDSKKIMKHPKFQKHEEFSELWQKALLPEVQKLVWQTHMEHFAVLNLVEHCCWKLFLTMRPQKN